MVASFFSFRGQRRFALGCLLITSVLYTRGAEPTPLHVTFGQLASCPLNFGPSDKDSAVTKGLPETIRALVGREIELTGYMLPLVLEQGRARQLLVMRSQAACCFGQVLGPNEYVVVKVPSPGLPVAMDLPTTFRGVLRVAPVFSADQLIEFYSLEHGALAPR